MKESKDKPLISVGDRASEDQNAKAFKNVYPLSGNKIVSLDNQIENINTLVPRHPNTIYFSAGIGKSKSTTVINFLLNKDVYWQKFNRIIIISPTANNDPKFNLLKEHPVLVENKLLKKNFQKKKLLKIFDEDIEEEVYDGKLKDSDFIAEPNPQVIYDLVEEQTAIISKYGKAASDKVLLILDDCINESAFFKSKEFKGILLKTRHLNLSIMILSQDYKSLPKPLRNNIKTMFISKSPNVEEMKMIYNENKANKSMKEFLALFETFGSYDFMQIAYQNDVNHQLIKNIESYIL